MKKTISIAVICTLLLASCGGGTVSPTSLTAALSAVGDAAAVAVVAATGLEAAGVIPPDIAQIIISAGQGTSSAVSQSVSELNSSDTNPVKVAKILSFFQAVALNTTGMPPEAAALVNAIGTTIQTLLIDLGQSGVLKAAKANPTTPPSLILSRADKRVLSDADSKAKANMMTAKTWKPVHAARATAR